jgi:hypothetical protein
MTASGGNSPSEVASEVTEGIVVIYIECPMARYYGSGMCTPRAKPEKAPSWPLKSHLNDLQLMACEVIDRFGSDPVGPTP